MSQSRLRQKRNNYTLGSFVKPYRKYFDGKDLGEKYKYSSFNTENITTKG